MVKELDVKRSMIAVLENELQEIQSIERETDLVVKAVRAADYLGELDQYDKVDLYFEHKVAKVTAYKWKLAEISVLGATFSIYLDTHNCQILGIARVDDRSVSCTKEVSKDICELFNKCIEVRVRGVLDLGAFEKEAQERVVKQEGFYASFPRVSVPDDFKLEYTVYKLSQAIEGID